tara:strand:- start:369 stop:689 length:321 start_codon:yes stop_codon:yes gene_type:complete
MDYYWPISDKYKLQFLDLLEFALNVALVNKINAQFNYKYDLLHLDYIDKPNDARIYIEHEDALRLAVRKYARLSSIKSYFLKQFILEGKVFKRLPEDVLKYIVGYV